MRWSRALVCALLLASALAVVGSAPVYAASCTGRNGLIAFGGVHGSDRSIYTVNANGTGQTQLTTNTDDADPSWSPDGKRIAFSSARDGHNWEIYVMNADGSAQTRLTNNTYVDWQPTWSPDGTKLAFGSERDGDSEIYIVDVDSGAQTRLTNSPLGDDAPSWSPDGQKIAFVSGRDGMVGNEIYVMNADGTGPTRLTMNESNDAMPSWSPDGSKIAFVNDAGGVNKIYVMNADGTEQIRLSGDTEMDTFPAWSPDGSKIAHTRTASGSKGIFTMNADGTGQADLTYQGRLDAASAPSWQWVSPSSSSDPTPPGTSLSPSNTPLPPAAIGKAYAAQLGASGGTSPYAWTLTEGSLPPGLSLSAAGAFSGTPTALGTSYFTVRVTDAVGEAVTSTYCIAVSPMAVSTQDLPDAYDGKYYAQTLKTIGGSGLLTWSVSSGSLPPGLKLARSGALSGTPTLPGAYAFSVKVKDSAGKTATRELTLQVRPLTVVTESLPHGLAGAAYPSTRLQVRGGKATYAWSIVSGSLPAGLKLSASGYVNGIPVGPGSSTFTVKVTDGSVPKLVATRVISMEIVPMTVATATLPSTRRGAWYSSTLQATGGKPTRTWSLTSGALPTGLRLSAGGGITGRSTASGNYTFTVRVADASVPKNIATKEFSILVN